MFLSTRDHWSMCPVCFYNKPDCLCAVSTKVANDNQSGQHALFDMACSIAARALGLPPEGLLYP
jgi:hypothetical protein